MNAVPQAEVRRVTPVMHPVEEVPHAPSTFPKGEIPGGSRRSRVIALGERPNSLETMSDVTTILAAAEKGEPKGAEELLTLVYDELRRLAASKMTHEPPGQTLQPTALVHEVWLRLTGGQNPTFNNRQHFFRAAAEAMRHILIDRARRKQTQRHGGQCQRVDWDDFDVAAPGTDDQVLAVHQALDKLALKHPAQAEVVKLRYFAGMTNEEISQLLDISVSTAKNYWNFARAWLYHEIEGQ
jgi:RNA polymerase sigma factor (TIGR02999 family)